MGDAIEVRIPDIGDFEDVEVVEVLVGPGDRVEAEDSLVSIESDKATMEIPSPAAGVVGTVHVSLGDRVSEGTLILELTPLEAEAKAEAGGEAPAREAEPPAAPAGSPDAAVSTEQAAPDGGEVAEAAGGRTPSPAAGATRSEAPATGPEDAEAAGAGTAADTGGRRAAREPVEQAGAEARLPGEAEPRQPPVPDDRQPPADNPHASPLVRRFARELGVDLRQAPSSGPHGRVLEEDVKRYVRDTIGGGGGAAPASAPGAASAAAPAAVDPSRFGPVHEEPLGKVRRISARNLSRSWQTAPHVTQHDEADLTELEAFRKTLGDEARARDLKLSPLHLVMKAVAIALREFPDMRSSLSADGERLIVKDYVHLGIAVDTDQGLLVPVVRDVDRKGLFALAAELGELAEQARARRLGPADMQGACFTISSLGGIGGTAFSPIVNVPEVAILGLSKLSVKPRWSAGLDVAAEGRFEPRIVLPLSLSYDHRVIDGAVAVRFTTRLVRLLSHPAHLLL